MPSHRVGLCGAMCCGNRRRTSHRTRWLRDEWWRCRVGDAPAGRVTDRSVVPCCRKPRLGKGPPDPDHARSQSLTSSNRSQGPATMVNPPKIVVLVYWCAASKSEGRRSAMHRYRVIGYDAKGERLFTLRVEALTKTDARLTAIAMLRRNASGAALADRADKLVVRPDGADE